jgi:hypothetical protein
MHVVMQLKGFQNLSTEYLNVGGPGLPVITFAIFRALAYNLVL